MQASAVAVAMRFGAVDFDPGRGELRREGRPVKLLPQASRVLEYLVLRAPDLVTRDELKELLWPDRPFGARDNGLNFCIRQVRAALGEGRGSPRYLETLRGVGYRFVAEPSTGDEVDRRAAVRILDT